MSPRPKHDRVKYSFYIENRQAAALKTIKERDGVLESEQIRRALDDWIDRKGVSTKAARQRARTRKRA